MSEKNIALFFESKKNANCVLEIEKDLLSGDENSVLSSILTVKKLFIEIFGRKMLHDTFENNANEQKFKDWLLTRYEDFVSHLIAYLSHSNKKIQVNSLEVLLKFVALEGKFPLVEITHEWYFPKLLLQKIVFKMVSDTLDQHNLIKNFKQYSSFVDVRFYCLKSLVDIFDVKEKVNDVFLLNCFYLLTSCCPVSEDSVTLLSQEGVEKKFHLKEKAFSKLFSTAWGNFLKYKLPIHILKKVLLVLPKKVMLHFQNPCLLTDFLTDLYTRGGLTSLLALSGLFELMQKYNVEYPDFYNKLYSLCDEKIVNGNFSSRFFYLSDLFLSSTHLPAYIVAAFIKRLSRISLMSNADNILKIIPLTCNLLIRHPTLLFLVHRTNPSEILNDPYDFNAADPAESNAMESSLWEIKTLQYHSNTEIVRKAKFINQELPKLELDLCSSLDLSMEEVYQKERKRKFNEVATSIEVPNKLKDWLESL